MNVFIATAWITIITPVLRPILDLILAAEIHFLNIF